MKSCFKLLLLLQLFGLNLLNASSLYSISPQDFIEIPQANHHSISNSYSLMDFAILEETFSNYTNLLQPTLSKLLTADQNANKIFSHLLNGDDLLKLQLEKDFSYLIHIKLFPFHSFW